MKELKDGNIQMDQVCSLLQSDLKRAIKKTVRYLINLNERKMQSDIFYKCQFLRKQLLSLKKSDVDTIIKGVRKYYHCKKKLLREKSKSDYVEIQTFETNRQSLTILNEAVIIYTSWNQLLTSHPKLGQFNGFHPNGPGGMYQGIGMILPPPNSNLNGQNPFSGQFQGKLVGLNQVQQLQQPQQPIFPSSSQQQFVPKKVIENYSYQLTDEIGKGYSSRVFRGKDERSEEEVAVKVIDMKMMNNDVQLFLLSNEISVLKKLSQTGCINILKLSDVFQTQNNTYIITEMCNQGDLRDLLKKYTTLEEYQAVKILKHVLNGYKVLAAHQIVHRDIKPANILINNGVPKLADFGFSKHMNAPPFKYKYNVGTPMYMCPQSLQKNEYSMKSDLWSIGVLYYELLYGVTPWTAESEQELNHKVCNVSVTFPPTYNISNESKDFIRGCLQVDERMRFSLEQMENHSLMKVSFKKDKQLKHAASQKALIPIQQQPSQQPQINIIKRPTSQLQLISAQTTQAGPSQISQNNKQHLEKENSPPSKDNFTSFQNINQHRANKEIKIIEDEQNPQNIIITVNQQASTIPIQQGNTGSTSVGLGNTNIINQNEAMTISSENQKKSPNYFQIKEDSKSEKERTDSLTSGSTTYENNEREIRTNSTKQETYEKQFQIQNQKQLNLLPNQQQSPLILNEQQIQPKLQNLQQQFEKESEQIPPILSSSGDFANNDRIILAQINLCRFLFRLSRLAEESNAIESPLLKEKLVFMILKNVMIKISKLSNLCSDSCMPINVLGLTDWSSYTRTEGFKRFQMVIGEYKEKYSIHFTQRWDNGIYQSESIRTELQKDKKFDAILDDNFSEFESFYIILQSYLRFVIREINHLQKIQLRHETEQLSPDLEQKIVFLDYLVTYFQLTDIILSHFNDNLHFAQYSKIEQIAEGRPVKLNKIHYSQIRTKILTLEI